MTFKVLESAKKDTELPINVSVNADDCHDAKYNPVSFVVNAGSIYVPSYIPGDVTGDGKVNPLDLIKLSQYISDGCETNPDGYNVTINEPAGDVNDDGKLNTLDLILISRYISDGCITAPDGYNVTLKQSSKLYR